MDSLTTAFFFLLSLSVFALFLGVLRYVAFVAFKHRGREKRSLDSVLLEVAVPRDNEIKIDAAEQMFAALFSIRKGGFWQKFKIQDTISFEIVARNEDIRFYVWCPKRLQDLIEKQIHGAFPDAQINLVPEHNIFSENGKVAYASLQLRAPAFYPIKTFKDLPTDPLSSLTSSLAKMGVDEGAAVQIIISPEDNIWKSAGKYYLSKTKKDESDPNKASYKVDAKTFEAIDNKTSKPGFETSIRIVVSSSSEEQAKAHLANIKAAFEQFSGELNSFKSRKIRNKGSFGTGTIQCLMYLAIKRQF